MDFGIRFEFRFQKLGLELGLATCGLGPGLDDFRISGLGLGLGLGLATIYMGLDYIFAEYYFARCD